MDPQPPPLPAPPSIPALIEFRKAGFWRRLGALMIDGMILATVGWTLGFFFADTFIRMGGWERGIGFAIACLYFVPLNGRPGGGRTVGKRALGIRVVAKDGSLLGIGRSFVRSFVLMLPHFINGVPIPVSVLGVPAIGILFGEALFGLGLSIVYLIAFNARTRQSLHDLAVGSYVVRVGSETAEKPRMWAGHFAVVAMILIGVAVVPLLLEPLIKNWLPKDIMTAYEAIQAEPEIASVQVIASQNFFWDSSGRRMTTSVNVNARMNRRIQNQEAEAAKLVKILLEKFPEAATKDSISVAMAEGYDLGIASRFWRQGFVYSPQEWRQRIESDAPNAP